MEIKIFNSVFEIAREDWRPCEDPNFPFTDYDFFAALESGACLGVEAGWQPRYLTVWDGQKLLGLSYLFLKDHSYGEYIFDWEWANAYARYGYSYYPKFTSMVPFTPATGPSFLIAPGQEEKRVREVLMSAALNLAGEQAVSSLHYLFIPAYEVEGLQAAGLLIRKSFQFHWTNRGYANFSDFLADLKRKRRQQIVKERREVAQSSLEIHRFQGKEIKTEHIEAMYRFYRQTILEKAAYPYLTQAFFEEIVTRMPEQILLCLAQAGGRWVAGSINFWKGKKLFGRYWGADAYYPFLHFELCYYQNLEFAIENGLESFEAGAQGGHKELRGLVPETIWSAHWIRQEEFREAIRRFVVEETAFLEQTWLHEEKASPYQKKGGRG